MSQGGAAACGGVGGGWPYPPPYEGPHHRSSDAIGVPLSFNYWLNNGGFNGAVRREVLTEDVAVVMRRTLALHKTTADAHLGEEMFVDVRDERVAAARRVVLVVVNGLNALTVVDELPSCPFLQRCTTVPTRHARMQGHQARPSEVCQAASLLLWQDATPVPESILASTPLEDLLCQYAVVFIADHPHWKDCLLFTGGRRADDIDVSTMSNGDGGGDGDDGQKKKEDGPPGVNQDVCYTGGFKRMRAGGVGDTWILNVSRGTLQLRWRNWPAETLHCSNDTDATANYVGDCDGGGGKFVISLERAEYLGGPSSMIEGLDHGGGGGGGGGGTAPGGKGQEAVEKEKEEKTIPAGVAASFALTRADARRLNVPVDVNDEPEGFVDFASAVAAAASGQRRKEEVAAVMEEEEEEEEEEEGEIDEEEGEVSDDIAEAAERVLAPAAAAPAESPPSSSSLALGDCLLAVDCEMCYTAAGLELTRVSVVDAAGTTIYDRLVVPERRIIDYNTQYSGITEAMLEGVTTRIGDVQRDLIRLLRERDAFLVGHSIESDLRAMKLIYPKVIDTAFLFPAARGAPFKRGLKFLMENFLNVRIQDGEEGHDSSEDARSAIELTLLRMARRSDPWFGMPSPNAAAPTPLPPRDTLFSALRASPVRKQCRVFGQRPLSAAQGRPWADFNDGRMLEGNVAWLAQQDISGRRWFPGSGGGDSRDTRDSWLTLNASEKGGGGALVESAVRELGVAASDLVVIDTMFREEPRGSLPEPRQSSSSEDDAGPPRDGGNSVWCRLNQVDEGVRRLHDAAAEGTLIVVVAQGDLTPMTRMNERKVRSRWEKRERDQAAERAKSHGTAPAGDGRLPDRWHWRDDDEMRLIKAADCAMHGVTFLCLK